MSETLNDAMTAKPDAKIVFLKQMKMGVSDLIRAAIQEQAMGCVLNSGDRLSAFQVYTTMPEGPVVVTGFTRFVFSG